MKVRRRLPLSVFVAVGAIACLLSMPASAAPPKPSPDVAISMLKAGNERFVSGQSQHPHSDAARLAQAGTENQGDHAYATVITCSDSRVPVEHLFDAGVMDIFVIRVAGNVCDTDEAGSIEYGLAHVKTPVLVVLGHTQCGAVTAVTHAIHGTGHALERNIPPLVDNIQPAVKRAMAQHPQAHGDDVIPYAIIENVWQGIEDLYLSSPAARELVKSGKAKVVGAIYDVGTGEVSWLPESESDKILARVEQNPARAMNAMAEGGHGSSPAPAGHTEASVAHASASDHGSAQASAGHAEASAEDQAEVASILKNLKSQKHAASHTKEVSSAGLGNTLLYGLAIAVALLAVGLALFFARVPDQRGGARLCWTLGAKLIGGFGVVVVLLMVTAVFGLVSMNRIGVEIAELGEEMIPLNGMVAKIEALQLEQAVALERAFRFGEEEGHEAEKKFEEQIEKFDELATEVDALFEEAIALIEELPALSEADAQEMGEMMDTIAGMEAEHKQFDALADKTMELLHEGKIAQARLLEETVEEAEDQLDHEIVQFAAMMEERAEAAGNKAEADEKRAATVMLIVSLIAVVLGFALAILLTRGITKPVNNIIAALSAGSEQVAAAAGQVSAASQSLAEGTTEQAAGLEEASSSLEEISSMTRQNADNATEASKLAEEANRAANSGSESMARMSRAIGEIRHSSEETAKIIKVIDEIAFQTNLLALNAAVEAARAGEAGKGFAVVAEEVRNLAMRSAEAAKNTADMIDTSVKNAQNGVSISAEVGKSLEEIVGSVTKSTGLIAEIASAGQEQASGIDQINIAVSQMDQVTQQNAANAEETASASEELSAQAEQMNQAVAELVTLVNGSAT